MLERMTDEEKKKLANIFTLIFAESDFDLKKLPQDLQDPSKIKALMSAFVNKTKTFAEFTPDERLVIANVFSYANGNSIWKAVIQQPFDSFELFFDYQAKLYFEENARINKQKEIGINPDTNYLRKLEGYMRAGTLYKPPITDELLNTIEKQSFKDLSPEQQKNCLIMLITFKLEKTREFADFDSTAEMKNKIGAYLASQDSESLQLIQARLNETYTEFMLLRHPLLSTQAMTDFNSIYGSNLNHVHRMLGEMIPRKHKDDSNKLIAELRSYLPNEKGKNWQKYLDESDNYQEFWKAMLNERSDPKARAVLNMAQVIRHAQENLFSGKLNFNEFKQILYEQVNEAIKKSELKQGNKLLGGGIKLFGKQIKITHSRVATGLRAFLEDKLQPSFKNPKASP